MEWSMFQRNSSAHGHEVTVWKVGSMAAGRMPGGWTAAAT